MTDPVWPFAPSGGLQVGLDWLTQVIATEAGEQRLSLRRAPRLRIDIAGNLNGDRLPRAREILWSATSARLRVPDWRFAVPLADQSAGTTSWSSGFADLFEAGGELILWHDWDTWEVLTVSTAGSGTVTATAGLSADMPLPLLMPLRAAVADSGGALGHAAPRVARGSLPLLVEDLPDLSGSTVPDTYASAEIWLAPTIRGGDLTERIVEPVEVVDGSTGLVALESIRDHQEGAIAFATICQTAAEVLALEAFLHRRAGRRVPFWLATDQWDYLPAASIASGGAVTVEELAAPASHVGRRVLIRLHDGTTHAAQITVASSSGGTTDLTLDPVPSFSAAASDVARISELAWVRLDSDQVTLSVAPDLVTVTCVVPCMRLDHEL